MGIAFPCSLVVFRSACEVLRLSCLVLCFMGFVWVLARFKSGGNLNLGPTKRNSMDSLDSVHLTLPHPLAYPAAPNQFSEVFRGRLQS